MCNQTHTCTRYMHTHTHTHTLYIQYIHEIRWKCAVASSQTIMPHLLPHPPFFIWQYLYFHRQTKEEAVEKKRKHTKSFRSKFGKCYFSFSLILIRFFLSFVSLPIKPILPLWLLLILVVCVYYYHFECMCHVLFIPFPFHFIQNKIHF